MPNGSRALAIAAWPSTSSGEVGFLNPQWFEAGEGSGPFDRLDHIPALIGVDYERAAGADFLPHDGDPANIVRPVGAHLEFKMRESVAKASRQSRRIFRRSS